MGHSLLAFGLLEHSRPKLDCRKGCMRHKCTWMHCWWTQHMAMVQRVYDSGSVNLGTKKKWDCTLWLIKHILSGPGNMFINHLLLPLLPGLVCCWTKTFPSIWQWRASNMPTICSCPRLNQQHTVCHLLGVFRTHSTRVCWMTNDRTWSVKYPGNGLFKLIGLVYVMLVCGLFFLHFFLEYQNCQMQLLIAYIEWCSLWQYWFFIVELIFEYNIVLALSRKSLLDFGILSCMIYGFTIKITFLHFLKNSVSSSSHCIICGNLLPVDTISGKFKVNMIKIAPTGGFYY